MFFTQFRMTRIIIISMTMFLCGCASRPQLSFPTSLIKAIDGDVVSLKPVAQDGQNAFSQSARSVRTPQHWPQPGRHSAAMSPRQMVPFRSHPVQRLPEQESWNQTHQTHEVATPLVTRPQGSMMNQAAQPPRAQQHIRQVAQQQSPPPIIIQWDDHKRSTGIPNTTRTFSSSTFNPAVQASPHATRTQTMQVPEEFCPPAALPPHTTTRLGDGCGDSGKAVDFGQIAKLVERVEKMETELTSSNQSIKELTTSLASARGEITQMKQNVEFWQSEVVRLERSMKAQHLSDINSLNKISKVLETLLTDESNVPAFDDMPPEFDLAVDPFAPISR